MGWYRAGWLLIPALILVQPVRASIPHPCQFTRINKQLAGQLVDYTRNHGRDRRIWSPSLHHKRDMYVYLPPGFDPGKQYPLAIYLHGFLSDEMDFVKTILKPLDEAIACGKLAPIIIAAPDGSPRGAECITTAGTFYVNSKLGAFEDYLVKDVYSFLMCNYPIRPEPEAHVLLGVSMGGGASFCKVMKHRDKFGIAAAFAPPLNLRWISCRGCYFDNFDPACWGWRTDYSNGREVVGIFFNGLVKIRLRTFVYPLYGKGNPDMPALVAKDNPVELLDTLDIPPGFAEFFVSYGSEDEFNLDAQIESFLYRARQRGIEVTVVCKPGGKHDEKTGLELLPSMIEWLAVRLEPYRVR